MLKFNFRIKSLPNKLYSASGSRSKSLKQIFFSVSTFTSFKMGTSKSSPFAPTTDI